MRRTLGEIYELNKSIYDKYALEDISVRFENGNIIYPPFVGMTYWRRHMVEKINENKYISFLAEVDFIEETDSPFNFKYTGEKIEPKSLTKQELIRMFGFEHASNPRSKARREVENENPELLEAK